MLHVPDILLGRLVHCPQKVGNMGYWTNTDIKDFWGSLYKYHYCFRLLMRGPCWMYDFIKPCLIDVFVPVHMSLEMDDLMEWPS